MRTLVSRQVLILFLIVLFGAVLRFVKLAEYPIQLNHDEITQLYDAISIAHTGKDIYGNFLPFIFPSIGDFKPPFYTYITSFFYLIIGGGEITIRLPAAIFGLLTILAVYFFVIKLLKNRNIALLAAFFTSIAPFEIFFSRKSFENGAGIFLMLMGFSFLFQYLEKKKLIWIYLAGLIFGIAIYTYFSHAIIIPLLLTFFICIYRKYFLARFKKFLGPLLLFACLILPLFVLILTNSDTRFRTQTVFVGQDVNLGRELGYVDSSSPFSFLQRNKITFDFIFNRYLQQFNPVYLFGNGLDFTNQGLIGIGPLLLVQFPFLILGLLYLLRQKDLNRENKFMAAWIILGMLPSGLTFESYSPHRVVMVFTMLNIICAAGLYYSLEFLRRFKLYFKFAVGFVTIVLCFNVVYFLHMYFVNLPFEKSQYIQYPFKQVALFAWSQYKNFDHIVFDPQFGDIAPEIGVGAHYYFAYFGNIPPAKFQMEYHVGTKPREVIFDKFSIRQVYWPADKDLKNTLVIASFWSVPESDISDKSKIIKRFYFYNGKLAFYAIKL